MLNNRGELTVNNITQLEVEQAQSAWADGLIEIGRLYAENKDYEAFASHFIRQHYAVDEKSPLLFKPTKARIHPFRCTFDEVLSYFVASNDTCQEDEGFALKPWAEVRFDNFGVVIHESRATAMGNYFFHDAAGEVVQVEYTMGYQRDAAGGLKLYLHHSSLPYKPR